MAYRRGMGRGKGKGYYNIINKDKKVHSDSAKGKKQPQDFKNLDLSKGERRMIENYFNVTDKNIQEEMDYLLREFGKNFLLEVSDKKLKKGIMNRRLENSIRFLKEGEKVIEWNPYENKPANDKVFTAGKQVKQRGREKRVFADDDVELQGGGYIAGGLAGRAVPKKYYDIYKQKLKEIKGD